MTDCGSAAGTRRRKDRLRDMRSASERLHQPRESNLVNLFGSSRVSTLSTCCTNLVDRSWLVCVHAIEKICFPCYEPLQGRHMLVLRAVAFVGKVN